MIQPENNFDNLEQNSFPSSPEMVNPSPQEAPVSPAASGESLKTKVVNFAHHHPIRLAVGGLTLFTLLIFGAAFARARTVRLANQPPSPTPRATVAPSTEESSTPTPSPTPSGSPSPTPKTSPSPSASPKISPSPTPAPTAKANLYYKGTPTLQFTRIVAADRRPANAGDVTTENGDMIYYQYESGSTTFNDHGLNQGDKISFNLEVENSETTVAIENNLAAIVNFSDSSATSMDFTIPALKKSDTKKITYSPEQMLQKSGNMTALFTIDSRNQVDETTESDNKKEFHFTVFADKTAPFLQIYAHAVKQSDSQVCYDLRAVFTRDNLDAIDGTGASKRTQLRFKTAHASGFTGWVNYEGLAGTFPTPECVSATAGQTYSLQVESKDQNGNVSSLTKSIQAQ